MRRLLFAPLIIILFGCSGSSDLRVKTDLGEEYIVKDSAVTVNEYSVKDILKVHEMDSPSQRAADCIEGKKPWDKDGYDKYSASACNQILLSTESYKEFNDRRELLSKIDLEKPLVIVRYRGIFIDLNKKKNALNYEEVACKNPQLSAKQFANITMLVNTDLYRIDKKIPDIASGKAIEIVESKICSKYAEFKN